MQPLQIFTFGGLRVLRGETPVAGLDTRKAEALLVYLACNPRRHPREVLADLFWDERSQSQAMANLRVALASLRKQLKPYLIITRESVALDPDAPVWSDVIEFEARLNGERTSSQALLEANARKVDQAVGLYQGEFLEGFSLRESQRFEAWQVQEREHLHRLAVGALHDLLSYDLQTGAYPAGLAHAERLLRLDSLDERATQQMMVLLARSGRRGEALAQYEACRRLLSDELGIEPAAETQALYEKIRSGELEPPPVGEAPIATEKVVWAANPYKGLLAFQEADASNFFGREALTERLVARLGEDGEAGHFLTVVGPSGSGKSSLVKAGLIPALRQGALPDSVHWLILEMFPGSHPFEELEINLLRIVAQPMTNLMEQLQRDERGLLRAVRLVLPTNESVLLLVIDQFEEVFTLVEDKDEARRFLQALFIGVTEPRSPLRVVLTLRADFFDRLLLAPDLSRLVRDRTELVIPLTSDEMERAIRLPAQRAGVEVQSGLVAAAVADMVEQPGALPLLQYALTETFEQRTGSQLALKGYQAIGGLRGVLERRAEDTFAGLSPAGQAAARQIFLRLVTLGEGIEDTRRRVLRSELEAVTLETLLASSEDSGSRESESAIAIAEVLEAFGRTRLLYFDRDVQARSPTVEIAHEALLSEWGRLREWLDEGREDVHIQRLLGLAAAEWNQAGRDPSFLVQGTRLNFFEGWAEGAGLALTGEEHAFLQASLAERQAQQVAEIARLKREADLTEQARQQARLATARELAAQAIINLQIDPERSILLCLHSLDVAYTSEAINALHRAIQSSRVRATLTGFTGGANSVDFSPDGKALAAASFAGEVTVWDTGSWRRLFSLPGVVARYSPDGRRLATGSQDGTITILDTSTRQVLLRMNGQNRMVDWLWFSPDGRLLVSTGNDLTLIVWEVETGQTQFFSSSVYLASFSSDGRLLVTLNPIESGDATVLWGVDRDWALLRQLPGYSSSLFSPDSRWLVARTGFLKNGIALWDLRMVDLDSLDQSMPEPRVVPAAHNTVIQAFAFNQDGSLLASAGQDGIARVWRFSDLGLEPLMTLSGHTGYVLDAAFSPNSARLSTACQDGTVRIWDLTPAGASEWFAFAGHTDNAYRLALTRDGRYLATSSVDATVKVWDLVEMRELFAISGHGGVQFGVSFSPDGSRLATAGYDNVLRVWDLDLKAGEAASEPLLSLSGHAAAPKIGDMFPGLTSVVFSPDGAKLASGGVDGMARIWDVKTGQQLLSIQAHPNQRGVTRLAYSPDGHLLATASDQPDSLAKIWDASSGVEISAFSGHIQTERIWALAFSPDGERVATASQVGDLKLWDAQTGQELLNLAGHTSTVFGVAFSPDGKCLVSASMDGTARVWDASSGEVLQVNTSPSGPLFDITFTPDGKRLIASGAGKIYGFIFDQDELIQLAKSRLTRGFTQEECRQFLHLEECPPPTRVE
jgi:WD40 repeat protein/DNA-binding SARP family transcriptional activator/type II secretory pathway predicted ATPase ExeA